MTNEMIKKLEEMGFKRWQKGSYDRLYINAGQIGLTCTYYNTGNISSAEFNGDSISNCEARRMKAAKTYIDLNTDRVHSDNTTLKEAVEEILDKLQKEEEDVQELQPVAHYAADNGDAFTVYEPSTAVFAQVPTIKCYAKRSDIPVPHLNYYADEDCTEFICTAGTHVRPTLDKSMMFQQFVYDHRSSNKEANDTITDTLYEEA